MKCSTLSPFIFAIAFFLWQYGFLKWICYKIRIKYYYLNIKQRIYHLIENRIIYLIKKEIFDFKSEMRILHNFYLKKHTNCKDLGLFTVIKVFKCCIIRSGYVFALVYLTRFVICKMKSLSHENHFHYYLRFYIVCVNDNAFHG